jgi:hypothetical protein
VVGPVRDVLMWTRAPFLFRNELVAVEGLDEQRPARIGEVKRLGERPTVALTKITKALRARSKIIGLEHRTKCLAVGGCRLDADPHRAGRNLVPHAR